MVSKSHLKDYSNYLGKNRKYYEEFFNYYLIFKPHLENNSGLLLLKDRLYLVFT